MNLKVQGGPAFEDHIPETVALRGLQSARTGQDTATTQTDGSRPRRSAIARRLPGRFRHLLPEAHSVLAPRQASPDRSNEKDSDVVVAATEEPSQTATGTQDDIATGDDAQMAKSNPRPRNRAGTAH